MADDPISCSTLIYERFKDLLGDGGAQYLDEFTKEFANAYKEAKGKLNTNEVVDAMQARALRVAADAKRNAVISAEKRAMAAKYVMETWADDMATGLEALLVGVERRREGQLLSAAARQNQLRALYEQGFLADVYEAGLTAHLKRKDFEWELSVRKAARALRAGQDTSSLPKEAVEMARIVNRWMDVSRTKANNAGASMGNLDDFDIPQSHYMQKIRTAGRSLGKKDIKPWDYNANRDAWIAYTLERLDHERTFEEFLWFRDAAPKEYARRVREYMRSTYDALYSGVHLTHDGLNGLGSAGKRLSHSRKLHFKGAVESAEYHQKFGEGSIAEIMGRTLDHRAKSTALMEVLGPDPVGTFNRLVNDIHRISDGKRRSQIDGKAIKYRTWLALLDGSANVPGDRVLQNAGVVVRGVTLITRLGMLPLTMISDFVGRVDSMFFHTGNLAKAWSDVFSPRIFKSKAERVRWANNLNVSMEAQTGAMFSRVLDFDQSPGTMNRLVNGFMTALGAYQFSDANRIASVQGMANWLHLHKGFEWKSLPESTRRGLEAYGMGKPEWDIIRHADDIDEQGNGYIAPELLEALPERMYKPLFGERLGAAEKRLEQKLMEIEMAREKAREPLDKAEKNARSRTKKPIPPEQLIERIRKRGVAALLKEEKLDASEQRVIEQFERERSRIIREARETVYNKYRTYLSNEGDRSILRQDLKVRGGFVGPGELQPGTLKGEAWRTLMQFKSFPAMAGRVLLGRNIVGRSGIDGAMTLSNAMRSIGHGEGAVTGLANLFIATTVFGAMAMTAKDVAKGRKPRDFSQPETWLAAMLQGGGFGIYGDFLFGDLKNRFGGGPLETLVGPAATDLADLGASLASIGGLIRTAEDEKRFEKMMRTVLDRIPSFWYTKFATDYMLSYWIRETMAPGYLQRMEQRIKEQNNQEFFIPPSEFVPYGGLAAVGE